MTIHKEGRTLLFVSLIILVGIVWLADYFFHNTEILRNIIIAISLIFYLLFLQFFRSPTFESSFEMEFRIQYYESE
jgi:phosphatidylserine decarboxylase